MKDLEQRIHRICDCYEICNRPPSHYIQEPDTLTIGEIARESVCALFCFLFGVGVIVAILAIF